MFRGNYFGSSQRSQEETLELSYFFSQEGISLRSALEFVSDGILIVNRKREIVFLNKSGRNICGSVPDGNYTTWPDYVGIYHSENTDTLFDPEEMPVVRALRGENLTDVRLYLNNRLNNSWKCISCNASPILKDQKIVGAIASFRDITEKLENEQRLRIEREAIEEDKIRINRASKLAALGVLAAELGHEINNPLAIIRSGSWMLRKVLSQEVPDRRHALSKLDEIDLTIQRISDIVTSVKNLSRESSREKMGVYKLRDILSDVQNICRPMFSPKGLKLRLNMDNPVLDEKMNCSRVQISEVLINLLANAVDAVESRPDSWIQIDVLKTGTGIRIRFTDSGPGVSEENEKKIFSPFFSTKEIGKGTGLGLSISKEIMKRHGGEIFLNREISANCFEVQLPFHN